jgi:hypothetical protein
MTWGELGVLRALRDPLDKYVYLRDLRDVDETGFFRLLTSHAAELLPIVYTPTVGDAAAQYHTLPISPQGLYVTSDDAGRVAEVLAAWPHRVRPACARFRAPPPGVRNSAGVSVRVGVCAAWRAARARSRAPGCVCNTPHRR